MQGAGTSTPARAGTAANEALLCRFGQPPSPSAADAGACGPINAVPDPWQNPGKALDLAEVLFNGAFLHLGALKLVLHGQNDCAMTKHANVLHSLFRQKVLFMLAGVF